MVGCMAQPHPEERSPAPMVWAAVWRFRLIRRPARKSYYILLAAARTGRYLKPVLWISMAPCTERLIGAETVAAAAAQVVAPCFLSTRPPEPGRFSIASALNRIARTAPIL